MYSQSFSPNNLYLYTTQSERRNSGLSKENLVQQVGLCIGDSIENGSFKFNIKVLHNLYLNNHPKGSMEFLCQDLVLRKLYHNIKRIYGIDHANRDQIVKHLVLLLKEDAPKWIIRLDVQQFYESINRSLIVERFLNDGRLNHQSICLLKKLFENPKLISAKGLPRGLSISSVMSELYMKYFDLEIRRLDDVFYYARFVDDIIIFCVNKTIQEDVWTNVPVILSSLGLTLNPDKSYKWNTQQQKTKLTYLGYTFIPKGNKNVEIAIAEKKVNTIKTRITKSFVRFVNDGDFDQLKNRIKFLTGNFTRHHPSTLKPIKVGLYFNYNMATDKTALYLLDKYYQKLLHCCTGRLGMRLASKLSLEQRAQLEKYSFVFGYENHVNHFFTSAMLAEITKCWR